MFCPISTKIWGGPGPPGPYPNYAPVRYWNKLKNQFGLTARLKCFNKFQVWPSCLQLFSNGLFIFGLSLFSSCLLIFKLSTYFQVVFIFKFSKYLLSSCLFFFKLFIFFLSCLFIFKMSIFFSKPISSWTKCKENYFFLARAIQGCKTILNQDHSALQ